MISEVRIANYKKFLNEKIPLSPMTIFVGPNGSGKSTVASALYSLATITRLGVSAAFPEGFYSFKNIINYDADPLGYKYPPIGLGITATVDGMKYDYDIFFNRDTNSPTGFYILFEKLSLESGDFIRNYESGRRPITNVLANGEWPTGLPTHPQRESLFMESMKHPGIPEIDKYLLKIRRHLQLMSRYQFSAIATRMASEQYDGSGRQPILKPDGSNLAEVVQFLQEEQRGLLSKMKQWIVKYAEGGSKIVDIGVATFEGRVFLNFYEEGRRRRTFEVRGPLLSDGYWIFSAFACLASCESLPSTAFFEEPEAHLHPHKLTILYEVLKSMTQRESNPCQVLISSHSPYFLDNFKSDPDSVILLNQGKAKRLSDVENYREILAQSSLGESWFANVFSWGNP